MDIHTQQALKKVQDWFTKASNWQKDLLCTVWEGALKDEQIIERATRLAGQEFLEEACRLAPKTAFPSNMTFSEGDKPPVVLKSITNVTGVGALAPADPLQFESGLTVVYGENGCGKSSYVRILKAIENPVNAGNVIENVFNDKPAPAKADVVFSIDGNNTTVNWNKACKAKCPIQIYDTIVAKQFVDRENEVIYEPKALSMITQLAAVLEQVSLFYKNRFQDVQRRISAPNNDIRTHQIINEFERVNTVLSAQRLAEKYQWDDAKGAELADIIESLKESDPANAATVLESKKKIVRNHGYAILELLKLVDDSACETYLAKRAKQIETKQKQDALVISSREQSLIDGFGCDHWRKMWACANEYIKSIESSFCGVPLSSGGKCALCQQDLDTVAKSRIQSFKEFFESQAMKEAKDAFDAFSAVVRKLQEKIENSIDLNALYELLSSSGISETIQAMIMTYYSEIVNRCEWLLGYDDSKLGVRPKLENQEIIVESFAKIVKAMDSRIAALKDAGSNQAKLISRKNELLAIQWVATNLPVKAELLKLQSIISDCKTNSLTSLKKELSRLLITDAYISRFQAEMLALDERGQIKADLVEASPKRGKSYHQVSLRGAKSVGNHKNGEVLSEGEFRVVSLAAFLADLSAWGRVMPFVFDDPITSLDHKFEARVADRLVKLSLERQVIVFTHRLAFAQLLDGCTNKYNAQAALMKKDSRATINHIELRNSPLGQPNKATYLQRIAMQKALNAMLNEDCRKIERMQKERNYDEADHMLQSLAARFRNLLEQGIEHELLCGIVSRFDYRVLSLKLPYLFAITEHDIDLFHKMMTKYSCYDHSHSIETVAPVPEIEELEKDLNAMLDWTTDYEKRRKEAKKKTDGKG